MLRKFKITIDGKEYLVEMEEIGGVPQPTAPAPATAPVAPAQPAPAAEATPAPAAGGTGDAMGAPMPGTLLKILVNVGDTVKENQPVMILEAMKMENEIVAPHDGTVTGIHVSQGDIVNPGQPLLTIS